MKLNIKFLSVFGILLFLASCDFQSNMAPESIVTKDRIFEATDQSALDSRMNIVNTPVNIYGENEAGVSLTCGECDNLLSGSGNLNLTSGGETYCILTGETYTADSLNFNGGTLKVCGTLKVPGGLAVGGTLENSGDIEVNGDFNINGVGTVINTGTITGKSSFNSNNILKNHGKIDIERDFKLNGSSNTENYCSMISGHEFHVNSNFAQNGYVKAGTKTTLNGNGKVVSGQNSYFVTSSIDFNGDFSGAASGVSRLDITDRISSHNSGVLRGNLDVNYSGTINSSKMESSVTHNGNVYIPATSCNPGAGEISEGSCGAGTVFTLVSTVQSPSVKNLVLSATDVRVKNSIAYVTYHTNLDKVFGGGIEIIDVNNNQNPFIDKFISFNDTEFNNIFLSDDYAFLSGQRDLDESHYTANDTKGAIVGRFPLTSDGIGSESSYKETPIPGYSANSSYFVQNTEKLLVATGGSEGAIAELSEDLSFLESESINYGKSITSDGTKIAILIGGSDGIELRIMDVNGNSSDVYKLDLQINPLDGKNVVVLDDNKAYITLSDAGLAVVDISNGKVVGRYNHGTSSLANSVDVDDCFVYLANGTDGLLILNKENLSLFGTISLPPASANFVRVDGDMIYVANGRGGLNIIRKN